MPAKTDAHKAVIELSKHWDGFEFQRHNKRDPWRILVSGIISARTTDEVTYPATIRLFDKWATVSELADANPEEVGKTIYPAGFYKTKGVRLVELANELIARFDGNVPDDIDSLVSLKGVGRKIANLVLSLGFHIPAICVDTHVHRISNRAGWVATKTPDQTETMLMKLIPKELWIVTNEPLVRLGQSICKPAKPNCEICPIAKFCKTGKEKQ